MKTRMALVAVEKDHEGPWQRALGHEAGIVIEGLGNGEVLIFEYDIDRQLQLPIVIESNGDFPFPSCSRFRFCKIKSVGGSETFAKIALRD